VENPSSLDLGVIGNCQIAALVDVFGSIVWTCLPRPDGDPVFCALLKRNPTTADLGVFSVEVQDRARCEHRYARNTAVLETTIHDARGAGVRITDFCPRYEAGAAASTGR